MAILSGSRKSNLLPTIYTEGNSDCGEEEISKPEIDKASTKLYKQYQISLKTTGKLLDIGHELIKPLQEKDSTVRRVSVLKDDLREYYIFIEDKKMKSRFSSSHDNYTYEIGYNWSGRVIVEGCSLHVDDINEVMKNLKKLELNNVRIEFYKIDELFGTNKLETE